MNLHRFSGVSAATVLVMADLYAQTSKPRQPRADEAVRGPASENPLTRNVSTSINETTIVRRYEGILKSIPLESKFSHHGGGTRLHRQQGRRHRGRFPGSHCRKYFRYHPQNMRRCTPRQAESNQGVAEELFQSCTNLGYFHHGEATKPDIRRDEDSGFLSAVFERRCSEASPTCTTPAAVSSPRPPKEALGSKATGNMRSAVVFWFEEIRDETVGAFHGSGGTV